MLLGGSQEPPNPAGNNTDINAIRAKGVSDYGEINIVSKGKEKIEQLGADSCYGAAADYSFTADYDVIFKARDRKEMVIDSMKALRIIKPESTPIVLQKLSIGDMDIFYFIPEYSGSNDVDIKFYGATKGESAFLFKIEANKAAGTGDNALSDSTAILAKSSPTNYRNLQT